MEFSTQTTTSPHQIKTAALGVGIYDNGTLSASADLIDRASNESIRALVGTEFKGKANTTLILRHLPNVKASRVILVGLGKQAEYSPRVHANAQQAFALACINANLSEGVSTLLENPLDDCSLRQRARHAAIAAGMVTYHYDTTLSKPDAQAVPTLKQITHIVNRADTAEVQQGLQEGQAIANGMDLTRLLGNLPPNICTPTYLANCAKKLTREFKTLKVEILERKQIESLNMGAFLSVARGSDEPACFIVLRHSGTANKKTSGQTNSKKLDNTGPIVLVGKGITFDSGGISIKAGANMDEMKYDMCGAASVLGTFRALAQLALPFDVIGLIPACENLPSGKANKPGDVVTSMAGHTIEILNTDAEGRLILCDALTYAERFKPSVVIDIATLTGACVTALGHINSGLFSKDDELAEALQKAGRQALDPAWRMPLEEAYQEQLKSNFADLANIGGPPAGSVTAACFLSRFTEAYRWAHLDIAGTAWKGGKEKGATGRPVPLLMQYLLDNF